MSGKSWRCMAAWIALTACGMADAQVLTLDEAVTRALARNPDLALYEIETRAQDGVRRQAAARPPIEAGLLVENVAGSGAQSGADSAETTLSLGFLLERGARERRMAVAAAAGDHIGNQARIKRLDVAAETARRFIVVLEKQREIAESREATKLATELLQAVERRVTAAKAPRAEQARASANLARAQLDEEHAEHELASSRHRLAALWGATAPDFEDAGGDLFKTTALPTIEEFQQRLERNGELETLVSEKRIREAELRLAEMRSRPPWHVTAGVRRFEQTNDHALVLGITVPIASGDLGRGATAEARARSELVDAQSTAVRARLNAEVFGLYQELMHAHTEVRILRETVLPRIEEALAQSRYAYERGRYGYVEWLAAQRELLDVRLALVEALSQLHQFQIELERLTGTALGIGE
jgi:cobalt-zinc-cadmium efflux system outer membrane protein